MKINCEITVKDTNTKWPGMWVEGPIAINVVGFPQEEEIIVPGPKFFIVHSRGNVSGPFEMDDPRFEVRKY